MSHKIEIQLYRDRPADLELASRLRKWAWVLSAAVLVLVVVMRRVKLPVPEGFDVSFLPPIHALINAIAAVVLILAVIAITKGRAEQHQKLMFSALGLSVLFLLSYVTYHFTTTETVYGETDGIKGLSDDEKAAVGPWRFVYLSILIPHIILAAVSFPFILFTFIAAWSNQFDLHKKLARRVFPIWLFVAVSGPICYLMLRPYY